MMLACGAPASSPAGPQASRACVLERRRGRRRSAVVLCTAMRRSIRETLPFPSRTIPRAARRAMAEVLAVRDVVKVFSTVRAVDGVSFTVRQGTITGLLGRNGAGKTTTIRMITGIFLPDSGTIECSGGRDRIGYLPEERGLYRQMKVFEQLVFLAEIKGVRGPGVLRAVD